MPFGGLYGSQGPASSLMFVWEVTNSMRALRFKHYRLYLALILTVLVAVPSVSVGTAVGAPKRITEVSIKDFPSKLVIGIVATGQVSYHVTPMYQLAPPRVAIEFMDAVMDNELRTATELHKGNVLRVRMGQYQESPPIARIVIDLVRPVVVDLQRTAPNIVVASVPRVAVTAAATAGRPATATLLPPQPPMGTPLEATAGTGLIRTAQQTTPGGSNLKLLEFRGVVLPDVLTALAKLCGFNLVTDDSVKGAVTLRLVDVSCEEALRFILEANGLAFRRVRRNIIVSSADKLAPPPEAPQTVTYRLDFANLDQVRAAIAAAVPGVRVAADPRTSSLLITGTIAQQEEVTKVLASLDVKVPQVMIQVHAIETNMRDLRNLGLLGGVSGSFGAVSTDATPRVSFRVIPTDLITFTLNALVTQGKSRILSAPRVATLDGNKASVNLVERIPIFTQTPLSGGGTTVTVSYVEVGVKLDTTPRVNTGGLLTMALRSEVSALLNLDVFAGSQAPRTTNRIAETQVQVKDGETIVIAGLIRRDDRETVSKVPLLGDIPLIGELFRSTNKQSSETEVVFLITPTIMKDAAP
jgi:hypothetical protein